MPKLKKNIKNVLSNIKFLIKNFIARVLTHFPRKSTARKVLTVITPIAIAFCITLYALIGATLVTSGCTNTTLDASILQKDIASELLRFHVIANSDSTDDQTVKMKVKEAVIAYLNPYLKDVKEKSEAMNIIKEQLENITEIANNILIDNGFSYTASSELSTSTFPVKVYGDITLPPGEYDALRIELGKAEGKNWWCIMFPQLCFVDVTYNVVPEESKDQLKNLLTDDEYEAIVSDGVDVEVKFKLLEWLKDIFD